MIIRRTLPGGYHRPFYLRKIPIGLPRHCRALCVEVLISLQSCHLWQHIITYPSKTFIPHHSESTTVVGASNSTWPDPRAIGGRLGKAWNLHGGQEARRGEERRCPSTHPLYTRGWRPRDHCVPTVSHGSQRWRPSKQSSTLHPRLKAPWPLHFYSLSWVEKAETVRAFIHFTHEADGPVTIAFLQSLMGHKGGDRPSSHPLYTRGWRPRDHCISTVSHGSKRQRLSKHSSTLHMRLKAPWPLHFYNLSWVAKVETVRAFIHFTHEAEGPVTIAFLQSLMGHGSVFYISHKMVEIDKIIISILCYPPCIWKSYNKESI